ncbi:MAG: adenylosuccinate lyase [Anaerolineales bacterium]
MYDYDTYLSPFTWRYGSTEMRSLWSEAHKRRLWRQIWVALAQAEAEFGVLDRAQVADLKAHAGQVDVPRALQIEAEIHHDLMAELKAFAEQCPLGGGALHLGATSTDIEDNADALRMRQSLDLILAALRELLLALADSIRAWADTPVMAFTHLQPAEPSTLGYRLAGYAQDLLADWENLSRTRNELKGKGFKGAVGTGASFAELVGAENVAAFEARLSALLKLPFYPVTTQTYPRKQDYRITSALAGLGATLYKLAFDLRILQSPAVGEVAEPFGRAQVGSSAMPFKRNPINAEKIDSLARALAQTPRLAWDNAAHSLLERTLDDSANRRTLLPEAFLMADELLRVAIRIVRGLQVDQAALERNLSTYGPFAASERVLMALGRAGADRQAMHERLRQHAMAAWGAIQQGEPNPLADLICQDGVFREYLKEGQLRDLMQAGGYVGLAPERARNLAQEIKSRFPLEN